MAPDPSRPTDPTPPVLSLSDEDLMAKAAEMEPITIVPTAKNIEIAKYLILWAASIA